MKIIKQAVLFDWDKGNIDKNSKHQIEDKEAEEAFFDPKRKVYKDFLHSQTEKRYILLGKTKNNRVLYTIFTLRDHKIRVVSSRDINKKEVKLYEKKS